MSQLVHVLLKDRAGVHDRRDQRLVFVCNLAERSHRAPLRERSKFAEQPHSSSYRIVVMTKCRIGGKALVEP